MNKNVIPTGWKNLTLGDVLTLKRGYDLPTKTRGDGSFPVVSSAGITGRHDVPKVQPPGVVTGRYGTTGEIFYINEPFWPLNTTLYVVDFKGNDALFTYYILQSVDFDKYSGKTGVPGVNRNDLHEIPMFLPPLPEQRAIAAILSTWDEAITLTEALIEAMQHRKQALMQLLLTGHKILPADWKWGRLEEFLTQNREYITQLEDKPYPRISVKWWAKGAVVAGYDNGLEVKMQRHQLAQQGQIIVSEIWAKHGSIGIIPPDGVGALITSHFFLFDFKPEIEAEQKYIYKLVDANYFMDQADKMSKGSTGYASLRAADFLRFKLPVPPAAEQHLIADVLEASDEFLRLYEEYRSQLDQQKRALMQQLLTGAIRVQMEKSMSDNSQQELPKQHSLQPYVKPFMSIVGIIIAIVLTSVIFISVFLTILSAIAINEIIGAIVALVIAIILILIGYVTLPTKIPSIMIGDGTESRPLNILTVCQVLLIACGFLQTFFWVIDYHNGIHEPRSVFILAVAGATAYFRDEIQKALGRTSTATPSEASVLQ